jgi:hypothetical protein
MAWRPVPRMGFDGIIFFKVLIQFCSIFFLDHWQHGGVAVQTRFNSVICLILLWMAKPDP